MVSKEKIEIVPLGNDFTNIESKEFIKNQARKDLQIPDNEVIFLFVGQIIWEKNIRMLVESLALINGFPFKMYFIGIGYATDDLKQLVNQLGLNDKVKFDGDDSSSTFSWNASRGNCR